METLSSVLTFATAIALYLLYKVRTPRNLPPHPPGLPFLGNVFQVGNRSWLQFEKWKMDYGNIISLNMAGQPVIILNSQKVANDLLDRRSSKYSDRPKFIMAGDILTGGLMMTFVSYGDFWRRLRRAVYSDFNQRSVERYRSLHMREASALVADLLRDPESWAEHIRSTASSSILSAVYGWPRLSSKDGTLVKEIHAHIARLAHSVIPGAFLVELFPVLRYLPRWIAKWKRDGEEWHRKDSAMFERFVYGVKEKMAAGDDTTCLVAHLLQKEEKTGLSNKQTAWLAGNMFGAGAETTAASMIVFVLAMTLYPDVMHRAQNELDTVVGRDRLPVSDDEANLPYISAIVKEMLRWRPVGPLGVPRRVVEDDWYEGYHIPKGSTVIANVWAMNRDPTMFPDFDEFRPERFLDEHGRFHHIGPNAPALHHVSFGFGRRACPGIHFASHAMFIYIATILWALNIESVRDEDGHALMPDKDNMVEAGAVVVPAPFKCNIKPRSQDVEAWFKNKQV